MSEQYLRPKEVREMFGISESTLLSWEKAGRIKCIRTEGGHARYLLSSVVRIAPKENTVQRRICYARVSTREQKEDLERQVEFFRTKYPEYEIIRDIGSGLNFKRKGFKAILDAAIKGTVREVIITHKDRFSRFGFELFEDMLKKYSNGKFVVLNRKTASPQEELVSDLIAIITVFSSRLYGLRSHKVKQEIEKLVQEAGCSSENSKVQISEPDTGTEEEVGASI